MIRYVILGCIALVGIGGAVLLALRRLCAESLPAVPAPLPGRAMPSAVDDVSRLPTRPPVAPAPSAAVNSPAWLAQAAEELRLPLSQLREQVAQVRCHAAAEAAPVLVSLVERLAAQVEEAHAIMAGWTAQPSPVAPDAGGRMVDLRALARDFGAALAPLTAPPGDVPAGPPVWVRLAPATLEEALAVLLHNAWEATPTGLVEVVVRVIAHTGDRHIALTIADRRAAPLANVWDALELDFVRILLEEYAGTLEVAPRGGGGRLTTIWLPATWLADTWADTAKRPAVATGHHIQQYARQATPAGG